MSDEILQKRQDNELDVLQAIFGDAVVDNRKNIAWKIWRPLDLLLTLNPLHNSDVQGVHCSVTLHIKCCSLYPNKPPSITINKVNGLSTNNASRLLSDLQSLAMQSCGEVMIFDLAQHTQQFLYDHNKPTLSFYEEMLKQKTEMERLKMQDLQIKEDEERKKIKDEIQKRQEMLREAGRKVHRSSHENNNSEGQSDSPELVFYADKKISPNKKEQRSQIAVACTCSAKSAQVIRITQRNYKKVYVGNCLGHSPNGAITYLAIDDETGERLITKKWSISPASDFQTRNRQLTCLQKDLKAMCRLKHSSLVPYVAMETLKETKRTTIQSVFVFRDFVQGSSLRYLLNKCRFSDKYEALKLVRSVGVGVFGALKELHGVSVVHRDVRCENVFLDDFGGVKLVSAGLDMRLAEMFEGESYCERQTPAQDIYAAAQLMLSILCQEGAVHEIPPDLPTSAKDFLSRCLTEDEHSQWTAEQLLNHGFLVDVPAVQLDPNKKNDGGSGSEDDDTVKKIHLACNGHSRLNAEFEALRWLGKGAFGDVLKVKNKLDGGFYAIKRIKLNPERVQLNKKITREVKLLSRLNHENVVRYYNAWIESTSEPIECQETSDENITPTNSGDKSQDVVEKLGQEVKVEWSISESHSLAQKRHSSSDSDDEVEDDEDDDEPGTWFKMLNTEDESSYGVEFEEDSKQSEMLSEDVPETPRPKSVLLNQVLYIQMEFCEKRTLRQAIGNGLYQEHFRAWRLFREIVEGLAHVHQRGMIHRDLKPMNIFLDSNDHVKIGDFGLATKVFTGLPVDEKLKSSEEIGNSMTGRVGTALYLAPELLQAARKIIYNQKVDIYSLGIILFEMFHAPFSTGMERMTVLTKLRKKEILIPKDFETEVNAKQIYVIRWLLNHDASLRPTCAELLASKHVPRPVPEGALSGLLSHTLSVRGSRGYQRLISACLDQRVSAAEDITYHSEMKSKPSDILSALQDIVIKVFRRHGATEFAPPILMPRVKAWDQYPNAVKVMTASGAVCHLPHDLRLPFARHVAYNGIKYMRRYVVDRVFREKYVLGFHPREIVECAFDIVTPKNDTFWTDAELLVAASRAAAEASLKVSVQLNHTKLLQMLLFSCGVPLDKHADIYPVLVDVSFGRITSLQLQTHLTSLCITNRDISNLLRLMETEVSVYEVRELVTQLFKQTNPAMILNQAVYELEAVYRNAKALGCECRLTVAPFLAYNATQHSGVFWQMSVARNLDNKMTAIHRSGDIIAAGGRYDALVEEFWKVARTEKDHDNAELNCCSVGFSMSLERMAAILKKMKPELPLVNNNSVECTLICVCMWGRAGSSRDGAAATKRAELARALWAAGRACCPCPFSPNSSPGDAHELCRAPLVLLHLDTHVRVASWIGDRVVENKVPYIDVIEFVKQKVNPDTVRSPDGNTSNRSLSWCETEKSNSPNTSVTFITASERITRNTKRYCENQINTQITSILVALGLQPVLSKVRVSVLALACEGACVRLLASDLSAPLDSDHLPSAFHKACSSFPKRQNILDEAQTELSNITKQSNQNRSMDETHLFALYSIPDSVCRLIT